MHRETAISHAGPRWHVTRLVLGPALGLLVWWLVRSYAPQVSAQACGVAGVGVWMGVWWVTEAIALEATGLLAMVLLPLVSGGGLKEACQPYANEVLFLFLGGLILGVALEKSALHRRFGLLVVRAFGFGPRRLVGGFLFATAFVSMWVSNAAATVMMLPIASSVCALIEQRAGKKHEHARALEAALMLAVAFGASIGGVGTLIGTPPMGQMASYMRDVVGAPLTQAGWMRVGLPVVVIMAFAAWAVLARISFRLPKKSIEGVDTLVREELQSLGAMRWPQWVVLVVFGGAILAWVAGGVGAFSLADATIAVGAALLLFIIPRDRSLRPILSWHDAAKIPWGVLVMFGGGLSLAGAISRTGLDRAIADAAGNMSGAHTLLVLYVIALGSMVLTEFCNNTALVAAGLPVVSSLSRALGVPEAPAVVTMCLCASLGFMMPAGTAPNAIAFASGRVTMREMMHAGAWLDALAVALVPAIAWGAWQAGWV